jgi:hydroxymethylglutaryl-CoA synthase
MRDVGIEAIGFQPASLKLDLTKVFAEERGEEPEKYTKGLGLKEISLPDTDEDIVTLGASAAIDVIDNENLSLSEIGRIDVATESSFDRSKPVSSYIAGCIEDYTGGNFENVNIGERKFACIAGTQAINDGLNWIQSGVNYGRKALVIATDTAFYKRGGSGEATQGAGAVAILIDENPSITSIKRTHGYSSTDENDFLKPNQQYPSVNGSHSVNVYLNQMSNALRCFESRGEKSNPSRYQLAPFHTPFPGMVRKAAPLGYRHAIRGTDSESVIESKIGTRPIYDNYDLLSVYEENIRVWMDKLKETEEYEQWYKNTVKPTVEIGSRVGNWYTASVHVARLSGLWESMKEDQDISGQNILVASYGSGAEAEVHREVVKEGWKDKVADTDVEEKLENRRDIPDFKKYEDIHDSHNYNSSVSCNPLSPNKSTVVRDGKGSMGEREYKISGK